MEATICTGVILTPTSLYCTVAAIPDYSCVLTPLHRSDIFSRSRRPAGAGFPMSLLLHAKPALVHHVYGPGLT